jgi:hypothetical protein
MGLAHPAAKDAQTFIFWGTPDRLYEVKKLPVPNLSQTPSQEPLAPPRSDVFEEEDEEGEDGQ